LKQALHSQQESQQFHQLMKQKNIVEISGAFILDYWLLIASDIGSRVEAEKLQEDGTWNKRDASLDSYLA
jgi:hypothetical protein